MGKSNRGSSREKPIEPRGEARRPGREDASRPALGGRAHHRLVAEVPRDPRALRQEARELRGLGPARLRPAVVQAAQAILTAVIGFSDSYLAFRCAFRTYGVRKAHRKLLRVARTGGGRWSRCR